MLVELLTERQWLEQGRVLKKGALGSWRCPSRERHKKVKYYERSETRSAPDRAARLLREIRREAREKAKARRLEREVECFEQMALCRAECYDDDGCIECSLYERHPCPRTLPVLLAAIEADGTGCHSSDSGVWLGLAPLSPADAAALARYEARLEQGDLGEDEDD